mmetsp:Transcript_65904/g.176601  ORF Transcript_65904/g.176601 Transcript_65904/m.176601 type:complete len:211 (+) Transcript_65904:39-671(+)
MPLSHEHFHISTVKMHVLVVDDDCGCCLILRKMIENCGAACDIAHSGEEAVSAMSKNPCSLVFMDLCLPGDDGDVVAANIRSLKSEQCSPVVVGLISHDECRMRQRCLEAGMIDVLPKPVVAKQVRQIIERVQRQLSMSPDDSDCRALSSASSNSLRNPGSRDFQADADQLAVFASDLPQTEYEARDLLIGVGELMTSNSDHQDMGECCR